MLKGCSFTRLCAFFHPIVYVDIFCGGDPLIPLNRRDKRFVGSLLKLYQGSDNITNFSSQFASNCVFHSGYMREDGHWCSDANVAALSFCSASLRLKKKFPFLTQKSCCLTLSRFHSNIKGLLALRCYKMWQHSLYPSGPSVLLFSSHPGPAAPLLPNRKATLPPCPPISSNLLDIIWFWPQFAGHLGWMLPLPIVEVFLSTFKETVLVNIPTEQEISVQAGRIAVCLCDLRKRKHNFPSKTNVFAASWWAEEPPDAVTLCQVAWTIGFQPP